MYQKWALKKGFRPDEDDVVKEMRFLLQNLTSKNLLEHFNDASARKEEALSMFKLGFLSLEDKAKVEHIYWQICKVIHKNAKGLKYVPDDVEDLAKKLADQYLCNFSVFQSMPDHWAIQQLFPVAPLHRHDEEPTVASTLVDITCDSDGKVNKFIDLRDIKDTIPLHQLKSGDPYYLGFFLMGAYQDIMGDLHNLFGRVNEVHVFLDETEPGGYYIEEVIRGNTIASVVSWIQYSATDLEKQMKAQIDAKVREGVIKPKEGVELQNYYERVLHGYTYVNIDEGSQTMQANASAQPTSQNYLN
jgi:arginine decarboxylase